MEGDDFSLEAVLGPAATTDPGEPVRHGAVEKKRERRCHAVPGTSIEAPHHVQVEAPAVALVGQGRFRESIGEHHATGGEPRTDDLVHVLGAVGAVEEELRERRQRHRLGSQEKPTDGGPGRGAARLARLDHRVTECAKMRREVTKVGRLTGALDALEGDEERHGRALRLAGASADRKPDQFAAPEPRTRPIPCRSCRGVKGLVM